MQTAVSSHPQVVSKKRKLAEITKEEEDEESSSEEPIVKGKRSSGKILKTAEVAEKEFRLNS